MLGEITLGQYYPADSVIHRLDPRVKFSGTLIFIIALFCVKGVLGYALVTLFLAAVIKASTVPFGMMLRGMKAIIFILLITAVFNLFLTPGETVLVRVYMLTITKEGLLQAVRMALRLIYLVIGSSLMTLTTTPNALTDGMEAMFSPLKAIHVPVHEIAMMMSIALRFIPILTEETDRIMKAQIARGADFKTGGFIARIRNMVPLLVPLFVSAFQRANDLAMAMEARCYHGGEGRTRMKPLKYHTGDRVAYLILAVFLAAAICLRVFGL